MKTLIRGSLEIYHEKKRGYVDQRRKVAWAVFSYYDESNGDEYRKAFTAPPFTPEEKFYEIAPKIIKE